MLRLLGTDPNRIEPSTPALVALVPPVAAGIVFFRLVAVEMLAVAIATALVAYAASRLRHEPMATPPLLPALTAVALVGPGAIPLFWAVVVAVVAVSLELAREHYTPSARLQAGLVAYALVWLLSRGGPASYVSPGSSTLTAEPIQFWLRYVASGQAPIDPVRLYVGNVAGPVFATSMLAVAVGAAWFWYARRLSLLVVLTFLIGVTVPTVMNGWPAGYQLLSGPIWFAAALVLADRHQLPRSPIGRPLVGLASGGAAMWLRARGYAIESSLAVIAATQVTVVAVQGTGWLARNRRQAWARVQELRQAGPVKPALPAGPS